jgi:hypothetical protein
MHLHSTATEISMDASGGIRKNHISDVISKRKNEKEKKKSPSTKETGPP